MSTHKFVKAALEDDDGGDYEDYHPDTDPEIYENTCQQCGAHSLGHNDPSGWFYCNACWSHYNQKSSSTLTSTSKLKNKSQQINPNIHQQTVINKQIDNKSKKSEKKGKLNLLPPQSSDQFGKQSSASLHLSNIQSPKSQSTVTQSQLPLPSQSQLTATQSQLPLSPQSQSYLQSQSESSMISSSQNRKRKKKKPSDKSQTNLTDEVDAKNSFPELTYSNIKQSDYETKEADKLPKMRGETCISKKDFEKKMQLKKEIIENKYIKSKKNNDNNNNNNEKNNVKEHLNLVIIGHVDAGKSTLMGHLLYLIGNVDNKTMHKYQKEASEIGKSSFKYAYVMDCHEEERKRGITVDVSMNYIQTPHRLITILDSPGHKDFIPNMISGTSQADAAILVINATTNEFETGFNEGGQTREHSILAKSLGVEEVIVAINKMDTVNWDQKRYQFIVESLRDFLINIGFNKKNLYFVPVSGLDGENLVPDSQMKADKKNISSKDKDNKNIPIHDKWYKNQSEYNTNKTLIEIIDNLKSRIDNNIQQALQYNFHLSITDVFKEQSGSSIIAGKILSGAVIPQDQLLIQPLNVLTSVKSITGVDTSTKYDVGICGDNVQLSITLKDEQLFDQIRVGDMISDPFNPMKCCRKFECKIMTLQDIKIPLCKGHEVLIFVHSMIAPAFVYKIVGILNKKTGNVERKNARHVVSNQCAIIGLKLKNKNDVLCLETYENCKNLGRVTIRREGETVAFGVVTKI